MCVCVTVENDAEANDSLLYHWVDINLSELRHLFVKSVEKLSVLYMGDIYKSYWYARA